MTTQLLAQFAPHVMQALSQGYNIRNVIDWLVKNNKKAGKHINEAFRQGYSYDDIGEYLTKGRSRSYSQQNSMLAGMTEKEKGERIANYQSPAEGKALSAIPKIAGAAALAALAPMALRYAVPNAIQPSAILPALQQSPQIAAQPQQRLGLPRPGPAASTTPPQQPPPAAGPNIPTAPKPPNAPAAPTIPTQTQAPASQILNNLPQIKTRIDTLLAAGNSPDIISGTVQKLLRPEEKNALKQVQEPLESIVKRYVTESSQPAPQAEQPAPEVQAQPQVTPEQPITSEKEEIAPQEEIQQVPFTDLKVKMLHLRIAEENLAKGKGSVTPNSPVDVSIDVDTGKKTLEDGYHRYLAARGGTTVENAIKTNKEGSIPAKIRYIKNEKTSFGPKERDATPEEIKEYKNGNKKEETPREIKAKETVILPSGEVGEVKATNNKKAIVNINGKDHQFNVDELDTLPAPRKDLDQIYDDLINKMKEQGEDISKSVFMTAYDAPTKELIVWYLNSGDVYRFDNISDTKAKELQEFQERRTSGVSINGPWEKGTKSVIGSRMYDLIEEIKGEKGLKGLKKEDKERLAAEGKEVSPHARKYGLVYSGIEPAWKAKQEKMKAEAEEKRRKKKEEKEKNVKKKTKT